MKKTAIRFITVLLALMVVLSSLSVNASGYIKETADVPYDTFTYWSNGNTGGSAAVRATGMFNFYKTLYIEDFKDVNITSFTDVSVDANDNVYILDSTSSAVHVLDSNYKYVKTIGEITDPATGTVYNYRGAQGVYVSAAGKLYICDTENKRVLVTDLDGNLLFDPLGLPESTLIPDGFNYLPEKITVDSSDYIYVLCDGSYYGAILYSPKGEFLGFFGANTVATSITDALKSLWDKLTMTDEKLAKVERKLPFQFTDIYVDEQDFVYTATGLTKKGIERGQIKRMSPGGLNILESGGVTFGLREAIPARGNPSYPNIEGVAVNSDGYIFTYDKSSGYISVFDNDCVMLNTFGGGSANAGMVAPGVQEGTFTGITAIDVTSDNDIIVLDDSSLSKSITIFKINEHGRNLMKAGVLTRNGDYDEAFKVWQEVLKKDRNCQVAYSGIAKTYYAAGDYENALKYAQIGFDYETYSMAFEFVRNAAIEENIYLFAGIIAGVAIVLFVFIKIKRKKKWVLIKNKEIKLASRAMLHPSEVFSEIKQKKCGSVLISTILIIIYYITATLKETESGFLFKSPTNTSFNSFLVLLQTLGLVLLWTICNWAICTLQDGKGTMREIYIITSYSIIPYIIANIVFTVASNFILSSEAAFLGIFMTVMDLFFYFMIIVGTIIIHDYSFGKFVGTSVLSLLGILIVIFLGIVIFVLVQQLFSFGGTVYREFVYR